MQSNGDPAARSDIRQAFAVCHGAFMGAGLVSLIINLLMLTGPMFMLLVYDRVLAARSLSTLVALAVLAGVLYVFFALLDALRARILTRIGQRLETRLTQPAFAATLEQARGKQTLAQPLGDLERLRRFLSGSGPLALFDLPWLPLYLGLVFALHPILGGVASCGALVMIVLVSVNEVRTRSPQLALAAGENARATLVRSAEDNAEVVAAMGMQATMQQRWGEAQDRLSALQQNSSDRSTFYNTLTRTFRLALQSAVLGAGAWLAIVQEITPGVMIAASIVTARALAPVEQAVANWRAFVAARQGLARLSRVLEEANRPEVASRAVALPAPHEKLDVQKLIVAAPDAKKPILRGLSFALGAGDGLAVIGPSGCGKSTLTRALTNVWRPTGGDIRLDGAELNQWSQQALGRAIGYLPQDVQLFDGSIAENIARFDPEAASADIIAAARLAEVHDLITGLDAGYDTRIGPGGARLSGGQRQRVALARAFYQTPFLIVLDEPNAHLDADGEAALVRAIASMRQRGSIVIVVAHRARVIAALNRVLVLDEGRQIAFKETSSAIATFDPGEAGTPAAARDMSRDALRPDASRPDASRPGASTPGMLRVNVHG